jgi:hypothetical protein
MTGPETKGRRPALSEGEPKMVHLPLGPAGLSSRWNPIGSPELVGERAGRKQRHGNGGKDGRAPPSRASSSRSKR